MYLSLSHRCYIIATPSNFHHQSPFFNHKPTTQTHPPPPKPIITCKIIIDPSKKKQPPPQSTQPPPSIFLPNSVLPPPLNPFQKLAAATLDMAEKTIVSKMEKNKKLNRMADPAVQLEGNYAPVPECPVQHDLEVVGTVPNSVEGVYLRNGGNPLFQPISGHHFFDGDGMIHAIKFLAGNRVSYSCRLTKTNRLLRESALGKPIFPKPIGELNGHTGLARLALFGARSIIGLIDSNQGIGLANVAVFYFNGRLLAMSEDDLPYVVHITPEGDLKTIGRFDFDGQIKDSMIAHPKVDPITGDLNALSYNVISRPHLKYFKFDKLGSKSLEVDISLPHPTMIHDFATTQSHVIIPDHQMTFKLSEMVRDGSPVVFDRNKITRFGVMPKDASDESMIQWIDVPGCFCYHMWNAWEEYDEQGDKIIVVINSCMTPPDSLFSGDDKSIKSELSEIRLNLKTGRSTRKVIVSGMNLEGGQVNKQELGKKTRYIYLAIAEPWPKCSGIAKVDLVTGDVTKHLYGDQKYGGEPCFVPREAKEDKEEEGFLMSFVRDEKREKSEFVILKASNMDQVALVKVPTRVPYGFHGTFVTSQELEMQSSS